MIAAAKMNQQSAEHEPLAPVAAPQVALQPAAAPALGGFAAGLGNAAFGAVAARPTSLASPRVARARVAVSGADDALDAALARTVAQRKAPPLVARDMAFDMQREASTGMERELTMPPPRVVGMSAISDVQQAQREAGKVQAAEGHLMSAKAQKDLQAKDESTYSKEAEALKKQGKQIEGFVEKDREVRTILEGITDLSQGASSAVTSVDDAGGKKEIDATVGHEMRMSAFNTMYLKARLDFGRLEGVVNAFIAAHPKVQSEAGSEGGKALGRAVVGGGQDRSGSDVHKQVEAATSGANSAMGDKVAKLRKEMDDYTRADYATTIDRKVKDVAKRSNELKTLAKEMQFPGVKEDTKDEAAAKAEIKVINDDLAAARKGIDTIQQVATIALTISGMPGLPSVTMPTAVPAGAVATEGGQAAAIAPRATVSGFGASQSVDPQLVTHVQTGGQVASALSADVGGMIKDDLAKVMTNYEERISKANSKLEQAQYFKKEALQKIDAAKVAALKTEILDASAELANTVKKCEQQKKNIRDAANEIAEEQSKSGKKGGVDIAAISQALAEVTIFIEQAKAAKEQGKKEQELAGEMVKRREKLAGKYHQATGAEATQEAFGSGASRIGVAEGDKVYYDAELGGEQWLLNQKTIRFDLWSDKVKQTPDASKKEVETIMKQIDEYLETAEGFKVPLQNAMFGA